MAGEFDGIESLSMALDAGLGVAFVSEGSKVSEGVRKVKLKPEPDPVCVSVGWDGGKALDSVTAEFVEELKLMARG